MAFSLSQSQNQQIAKEGISLKYNFLKWIFLGITLLKKKIAEYCRTGKSFTFSENIFNDLLYLIRTTSHFEVILHESCVLEFQIEYEKRSSIPSRVQLGWQIKSIKASFISSSREPRTRGIVNSLSIVI